MFFGNSRIFFLNELVYELDCERYGNNQYKKTKRFNIIQCSKNVKITFILFKCHRFIENSISFRENPHDNQEFSLENSKPCCESRITIRKSNPDFLCVGTTGIDSVSKT